jgi:hypothetical protein
MSRRAKNQLFTKPALCFLLSLLASVILVRAQFSLAASLNGPAAAFAGIALGLVNLWLFYLSLQVAIKYRSRRWESLNALAAAVIVGLLLVIIAGFILSLFLGPTWDHAFKQLPY